MKIKINISPTPKQNSMMQEVLKLHQSGRLDLAETYYKKLLKDMPENTVLLTNFGTLQFQKKKLDNGIKLIKKSLKIDPNQPNALNNLGVVFLELNQPDMALIRFDRAITFQANYAEAYSNRGNALKDLNRPKDALESFDHAIAINPGYAKAHSNRGNVLKDLNLLNDALESYDKAISIMPNYANAYSNRGDVLSKLNKIEQAIESYEQAIFINPDLDFILGELLNAKMKLCIWDDLADRIIEIKEKIQNNKKVSNPFPMLSLVDEPKIHKRTAEIFIKDKYPKSNELLKIQRYSKHSKIKIGYFSADFNLHPVSILTAELYELHDRSMFEVHAFSFGLDTKDELNLRIKAGVDNFHDVRSMSNKDIVMLSRSLEIDIAVDLGGHTQSSRTTIFAMLAAPIQVSYIGYLGTMGANYYDYLLADSTIIPKESQHYYTEKIAYLPSYQVNDSRRAYPDIVFTRQDLGLPEDGFIYCCFNNTYKITPEILDSWCRILKGSEDSVLVIYADDDLAKSNLTKEASLRGIAASRLIFGGRLSIPEYLARYRVVDLFLDTHPYNAGTTASDALWMKLPVLTCIGNSFASRIAASLLNAVNLPEMITTSKEEYESLAIQLAKNPKNLKLIKKKLANNLKTAPLYNTPLFTKNIELAFFEMFDRYHNGLDPDNIRAEITR
jgi:protein O-GlcNAc transferase